MDMCNCLKLPTSRIRNSCLRRFFAVLFVFGALCVGAWAETYYWTGAAGDGKWSSSGNWNTEPDGSGTTPEDGYYPYDSDIVCFPKAAEINVDITTNEINGRNYLYIRSLQIPNNNIATTDFTVKLAGNPIYVDWYSSIEIYRATGTGAGDSKSTLEFDCDIVASKLVIHSGTTVQFNSGHTANIDTISNVGGNDYPAKIIVEGNLISQEIDLSGNPDRMLEITTDGSVETEKLFGYDNTVTNNGTLSISNINASDIMALNSEGNGTVLLDGNNTYIWKGTEDDDWGNTNNWVGGVPNSSTAVVRIEYYGPVPEIKPGEEYEIKSIDKDNRPRIIINGKLKINDDFCYAVSVDGEFIEIGSSENGILELTGNFSTKTNFYESDLSIICNDLQTSYNIDCKNLTVNGNAKIGATVTTHGFQHYAGTLSGDLNDSDPSDYSSITLISDYNDNNDSNITITGAVSKIATLEIQNYNDLTIQNTISDIENLTIYTTDASSATLNGQVDVTNEFRTGGSVLLKQNVYIGGDVYGPFISDNGKKLVFNGTGNQTFHTDYYDSFIYSTFEVDKTSGSINIGDENSDNATITNCTIKNAVETTFTNIKITNLTIDNIGTTSKTIFDTGTTIEALTDSSNSGDIVFKENSDSVIIENISTDQTFKTTGTLKFEYASYSNFGTESGLKAIKHIAGPTIIIGQISADSLEFGDATIGSWIETYGDQKYSGVVIINRDATDTDEIELISRNGNISFDSTIKAISDGDTGLYVDAWNGTTTFNSPIGQDNKALKFLQIYSPLEIASGCTAITTTDYQKYHNSVTINKDVTLTSDSTITFDTTIDSKTDTTKKISFEVPTDKAISVNGKVGNTNPVAVAVTQAKSITFNNTVNITEFTDSAASGDIIFKKGARISNASGTNFSTTGTVTFGNASTDETTFGTSPSSLAALTHSTGPTVLNGTLYASDITLGNTNATPGTISIPSGSISASGTVTLDGTLTSTDSVSITAGTLTFNAPVNVKNITMDAVATTSQDFTVTGNWKNNKAKNGTIYGFTATDGTVTFTREKPTDSIEVLISGENKFNELEILRSVKITADNEITTLTADGGSSGLGGEIITLADSTTQKVTGTMSLKGTSNNSKLGLYANEGDEWAINCTGSNNHTIQYVDVYNSNNSSSYNLVALNSRDSGNNTNWTFPAMEYKWNGTTDNSWTTATNWEPASVPGKGAVVEIQSNQTQYPIISSAIDLYYDDDNKGSITNYGTITFTETGSITADIKENVSGSTIIYDGAFTNATTLDWGYDYENLTFASGTFNLSEALTINDFTIDSTAKITTSADITVTGNWTNNNSTDGFTSTDGTVKLTPTAASVSVSGDNTFNNFTAGDGITGLSGKTITFEADKTQTVNGTLTLSGSSGSLLTLKNEGTGDWNINCTNTNISYVDVSNSTSTNSIFAINSNDGGHNTNWNFPEEEYEWTGADSTDSTRWDFATNWNPASVPGIGAKVTIPEISSTPASYPKLIAPLDITNATYSGTITVAANAQFDLADQSLTVGTITNNGLVRLKGSTSQIVGSVSNGTSDSTIEYYDTTTNLVSSTLAWGNSYKKLIINKPADLHDVALSVSKTTTIAAGTTNAVNLNNASSIFGETIYLGDSAAATPVNAGAVTINAASAITIANNANADSLTLNCAATVTNITTTGSQTYAGQITLAANGTLTASGASSAININANVNGSDKTLTIPSGSRAVLADGITVAPAVTNNGTITCSGAATFEKSYSGTGASLTLSNKTTTFKANLDLSGTTFDHGNGTAIIDETGTVAQIKGPATFNIFQLKKSAKIYRNNSYNTFTATNLGGKSISFEAGTIQTIAGTGTLTLSGNSDSLLTLENEGTGVWTLNCSNPNISYVDVINSTSINSIFAIDSNDRGYNTNWNFPGEAYEWTGADSTNPTRWNEARNWSPASVPGIGSDVTIPEISSNPASYPKLIAPLDITNATYSGTITIAANAQFDLADQDLTIGTITNNGLVRLIGASGQTISGAMINVASSTVEYYGTGATSTNFAWDGDEGAGTSDKQYANLILNQDTSSSDNLVMTGNLTINNPATLTGTVTVGGNLLISEAAELSGAVSVTGTTTISAGTGKAVTLNNGSNVFTGIVKAGDSTTTPAVNAGAVILKASSTSPITLANNANADSLEVQSAIKLQNVTTSGNQIYSGTVETITGATTINSTAGNINFENPVILGVQTSVSANDTDKTITFGNTATINGEQSLSLLSNGGITFTANIGNTNALSDLTVTGPLTVNCGIINTSGDQIYKETVTLDAETNITSVDGNICIESTGSLTVNEDSTFTVSTSEKKIDFSGAITGSAKLTTAGSGTVNFNNTVNVASLETQAAKINTETIATTGSQNFKGPVTLATITSLTSTTDGNITFDKTLDGAYQITLQVPVEKTISFTEPVGQTAAPDVKIMQALSTTFNETVNISIFTDDAGHTGAVNFVKGGTIQNDVTFNTNNTVSFTGTMNIGTDSAWKNLTHTAGETKTVGTISAATIQLGNLTLTGDTTITTTGTQLYNSTIDDSTAGTHTLILNSGTSQITFASDIGQTAAPKELTVNGPVAINCAAVTTTDKQNYNDAITSTGAITLKSAALNLDCSTVATDDGQTYDGPLNLLSDTTLTLNTGDLCLKSTLTGDYKFTIAKTNDAIFTGTVNVNDFEITQANDTHFKDEFTTDTFTITQATNTIFNEVVSISTVIDATTAGDITFKNGGNISDSTGTVFLTVGLLTIGDATTDIMTFGSDDAFADLIHIEGETSLTGKLNTASITLADTLGGPMIINNNGLFKTLDTKALTYTTSFEQIGSGNTVLGGSFKGTGNATFETNLQLYGTAQADFGSTNTNISVVKNLIINRSATDNLNIKSSLNITENLVLYNSPVIAEADITVGKDNLILGSNYSEVDSSTGITNEYAYTTRRLSGWSEPIYSETKLPDRSDVPAASDFGASLAVSADKTISVGKNFYVNGTGLSLNGTSGQWNLKLPDLTNPANGFAEAYHSVVSGCKVICNDGTENGSKTRLAALECTDAGDGTSTPNINVEFEDFKITKAYTVRDNAIRVEFNQPIRYHSTTIDSLKFHNGSDAVSSTTNFTGFYEDPDCQKKLTSDITLSYTDETDGKTYYYFYIEAEPQDSATTGAWNTDATGKSSGATNGKSSDRNGIHHTALPCLDFPRALADSGTTANLSFIITDIWGKRLNNYSHRVPKATAAEAAYGSANSSDASFIVADSTGPVMWTVRTGQEMHTAYNTATGEAGQHSYDAHNFLEFRYSEPVEFTTLDPADTENIQVTDTFGAIKEADIRQAASSLTFAGIAKLTASSDSSLQLYTGKNGSPDKYVNALYRTDEYSLRLSIAGWIDGTVSDYSGNTYKNWTGYIEQATQFTRAKASLITTATTPNNLIKDLAGNSQIEYAVNMIEPTVYSDSTSENPSALLPTTPDLYSLWDISKPVFTPLRFSAETEWGNDDFSEAIGNTNGSGSTLDRIDFHFFDNTPAYNDSDPAEWFTESGWCVPGSEGTKDYLYASYTYAADIIGGARQFDPISESDTVNYRRTSGGIRLSTKLGAANGFKYSTDTYETNPATPFATGIENIHSTVISQLFTGSSEPQHAANDPDGLYLGIGITDTALPVETSFAFKYDDSKAYLTDLAGNRLRSSKTLKTIDRTPPSFDIILSPVDQNQVYVVFVKKIVTDSSKIDYRDPDTGLEYNVADKPSTANFLEMLPSCFKIISINSDGSFTPSTDLQIDTAVPARIVDRYSDNHFTCVCLTLNKEITTENIKNLYLQLSYHPDYYHPVYKETSPDPWTSNNNARVTFIQDELGNYMQMYSAHALSDFAIGLVNPLYAYSSDITENDEPVMSGLYNEGSWAVHDWNAEQKNYGTLPAAHSAAIVTQQIDGTDDGSELPENVRIYLSNSPDKGSVSTQFNKDFGTSLRVWLPDLTDGIFRALSAKNNSNWSFLDSEPLEEGNFNNLIFNIPLEMINTWKSGDQISFMFGITESDGSPVKIYNSPYYDTELKRYDFALSTAVPLYALRMHDVTDIGSLDLWSFRLKGITTQRGGVTILNNVINASHGEKTVIKVDVPTEGKLNVIVMTLDGNIITYLHRGNAKAGENYFTWDGKNRNGNLVARGMYFIRVTGADFDETRKVMVVK